MTSTLILMRLVQITGLRTAFHAMQWRRGLRAGLAVGVAMLVCRMLHHPMGWAALGGLQVVMVDNGGPYRSRMANALTVLVGGSLAVALGVLAGANLPTALVVTLLFCFIATLARVLSQPLASSSVVILVCYIVAYGSAVHTLASGVRDATDFVLGGLWAAVLTLVLWPVDPFRPARNAVADVYDVLSELVRLLPTAHTAEGNRRFNELLASARIQIEAAQRAIAATPARMTARTIRARNLSVLNESADLLIARILRFAELGHNESQPSTNANPMRGEMYAVPTHLAQIASWLSASIAPIAPALRQRPARESAFEPYGAFSLELRHSLSRVEASIEKDPALDPGGYIAATLRDSLLNFVIAYEAIRAVWSGVEPRRPAAADRQAEGSKPIFVPAIWLDTLQANFNLNSIMFRHALRLALVVVIDVLLIRALASHFASITHGYWLAMTSIIVLQPYTGETVRRSGERVAGTVAGAVLAAIFAAMIHNETGLIIGISVGATLAVALYTVDYAWYCFFLTPTIVLMTMPHLQDWHFAAIRMGMTALGAVVAVAAMLLLWPERESLQLPSLLARAADAEAAYVNAMLTYWQTAKGKAEGRIAAERTLLAPARRLCGLAINDAEDTLDHALLEHAIPLNPERARTERLNRAALTFTAYLRRLTQTITTLAATGDAEDGAVQELAQGFEVRLNAVAERLKKNEGSTERPNTQWTDSSPMPNEPLSRMERQIAVLERAAFDIASL